MIGRRQPWTGHLRLAFPARCSSAPGSVAGVDWPWILPGGPRYPIDEGAKRSFLRHKRRWAATPLAWYALRT